MRQSSLYSLSLDQVQTQLGKPLRSMNLEELLTSVWSAESNLESGGGTWVTIDKAVGKRTVDQVWKDIQEEQAHGRQVITLGEMTLEDLLARAGAPVPMSAAHQLTVNVAMGGHCAGSPHVYEDDIQMLGRKRIAPGDVAEKTVERRQKRMIKNRESAARSRARKQVPLSFFFFHIIWPWLICSQRFQWFCVSGTILLICGLLGDRRHIPTSWRIRFLAWKKRTKDSRNGR